MAKSKTAEAAPAAPTTEALAPQPGKQTYPIVTREGNVLVTEFADGTVHRNAIGARDE